MALGVWYAWNRVFSMPSPPIEWFGVLSVSVMPNGLGSPTLGRGELAVVLGLMVANPVVDGVLIAVNPVGVVEGGGRVS